MSKNTTIGEKAKYEAEKEKERKRRFEILSGNITPIHTDVNLKNGEHAYFQVSVTRRAEKELVNSHTSGESSYKFMGGITGKRKISSTTTQERIQANEAIDHGTLLFTNRRVLFIGKQIISLPYDEIFSATFGATTIWIKYPEMLKDEGYDAEVKTDMALYYHGILRLLGKEKSKISENDVPMDDYPVFISSVKKAEEKKKSLIRKICIMIGIFLFMAIFLRGIIISINIIMLVAIGICLITYFALWIENRSQHPSYNVIPPAVGLEMTRSTLKWSFIILLFGILIAAAHTP